MAKQGFWGLVLWAMAGMAQAVTCVGNIVPTNPDAIYTVHGDGTVTDTRTGLMWKQCVEGLSGTDCATGSAQNMTWADALNHAENHDFAGFDDWRMPNQYELRSLVEHCRSSPAINDTVFPNTPSSYVWSGSPNAVSSNSAWYVYFGYGFASYGNRSSSYQVRLVRGGQHSDLSESKSLSQPQITFLSENLPDGTFQIGPATKRWRFRNGPLPLSGVRGAVRISADASLGISLYQVSLGRGDIAANAEFVVEVPVNPVRGSVAMPRSVWKLVDGEGHDVPITNSATNTFWMALRTNRPPRWSPAQLTAIGGAHGSGSVLPLLATDEDEDTLSFSVVSGGGGIAPGGEAWQGTLNLADPANSDVEVQKLVLRVSDGLESSDIAVDRVVLGGSGFADFFADVPYPGVMDTHSIYAATHFLAGKGIVLGCGSNGSGQRIFCPARAVTQAEALKMLLRSAEQRGLIEIDSSATLPGYDMGVPNTNSGGNSWAAPYAIAAQGRGLIDNVAAWGPDSTLSRGQLALWLDTLLGLYTPIALLEAQGTLGNYHFSDAGDFASPQAHEAALRVALHGYLSGLGGSFHPNTQVTRGELAVVAAKLLRGPMIDGVNLGGTTPQMRFGRELPAINHGQPLVLDGVQGLAAREILMSGPRVLEEWLEPAANYVRVAVVLPDGQPVGAFRTVSELAANPIILDTGALEIRADTLVSLIVLVYAPGNLPPPALARSGVLNVYEVPVVVDFPDQDGDGVRDDLDLWPDDERFALDTDGDGYPDEVNVYMAGLGISPADAVIIGGNNMGYTHGQAYMEEWPPYDDSPMTSGQKVLEFTVSGPGQAVPTPAGTPHGADGSTLWVQYVAGTQVTLVAQPDVGAVFVGWSGACSGVVTNCTLTMDENRHVLAAFARNDAGGPPAPEPDGGVPMTGTGTATVTGAVPGGGTGPISAQASGSGGNNWIFTRARVLPPPAGHGISGNVVPGNFGKGALLSLAMESLPADVIFPYGLIEFELAHGVAGSDATVVFNYPGPLPAGARYYKFGRTMDNPEPHWYVLEDAQIQNDMVGIILSDGGTGDDDGRINSVITDPGGPGVLRDVTIFGNGFEAVVPPDNDF